MTAIWPFSVDSEPAPFKTSTPGGGGSNTFGASGAPGSQTLRFNTCSSFHSAEKNGSRASVPELRSEESNRLESSGGSPRNTVVGKLGPTPRILTSGRRASAVQVCCHSSTPDLSEVLQVRIFLRCSERHESGLNEAGRWWSFNPSRERQRGGGNL